MACEHVMWGIICDSCRVELLLFSLGREKIMGILQPDFLVVNFPTKYFGGGVVGEAGRRMMQEGRAARPLCLGEL